MPASTITTTIFDTAFQAGNNARAIAASVAAGFTITKIEVIGALNFESFNPATSAFAFQSYVEIGIQYGAHGYTPVGIIGSPDASNWLAHEHAYPAPSIATYPSTGTSVIADRYPFRLVWRGQLPIMANSDFYFSDGSNQGSGVDQWKVTANTRLFYY